ncbi:hypothetical protein [Thalassospira alkalitolerans]|uniref:Uncharacterized protein n=1 Tax=Thalassospira alkalitolerans TaxID=1293890 RepID=A0A1Y2LC46_9PROT|nr:hypothetical protein [Thalassospira alkalitolerans]OSQ47042.1 hypothetical protein TALK_13505 [Thalassospira alkalitolerans]
MNSQYSNPSNAHSGSNNGGPPGQNLLCICLALLAAVLGTPYVFHYVGPFIERLVYEAYGWRELASFMYAASFLLTSLVIFAISRMTLWYAITAIVTFGALRFASLAV